MAAISKAWVTQADAAVDPDSPVDATLMTGFRDNDIHNREWIGASFFAGAVQDHNHDGANSALVPVGPNLLRNGSFEDGESGWTFTDFTGGSHAISTSNHRHGAKAAEIISTVLANGGGDAINNEYITVGESEILALQFWIWASVANISSKLEIVWYDNSKAQISALAIQSYTDTPTTPTLHSGSAIAPSTARFFKVRVTGGVPASGSATGTVRFDGIHATSVPGIQLVASGSVSGVAQLDITAFNQKRWTNYRLVLHDVQPATDNVSLYLQTSTNGGSSFDNTNYGWATSDGGGSASDAKILLSGSQGLGNAAGEASGFVIDFQGMHDANAHTRCSWQAGIVTFTPTFAQVTGAARRSVNENANAIRFLMNSGNIATMKWSLYGFGGQI